MPDASSPSAPSPDQGRSPRLTAAREGERVTPLELFFDLVFVLAITECTALMSHHPSWSGLAQGLLVLGVLWWAWVGYAWLTSVIDPEAGIVRLVFFGAMAAMLIAAICVPRAFGGLALAFALAIGVFRLAHIVLFTIASPDDPSLRQSVRGLAVSTAVAVALLVAASLFNGLLQGALWLAAIGVDMGGPYLFGNEGWKLVPGHFAERHGLIVIIALGESIVEIGAGAAGRLDFAIGVAAVLGVGVAAALWWVYFDVVALVSAKRLADAEAGPEQNSLARDSYSYLHLLLVAGIVLAAFGMKTTIAQTGSELDWVTAFALLGGGRDLPARAGRLPLPPTPHRESEQTHHGRSARGFDPPRDGRARPGDAGRASGPARLADRVRAPRLRRAPGPPAGSEHDDRGRGGAERVSSRRLRLGLSDLRTKMGFRHTAAS